MLLWLLILGGVIVHLNGSHFNRRPLPRPLNPLGSKWSRMVKVKDFRFNGHPQPKPLILGTTMTVAERSHAPVTQMIQVKDFRLKGHPLIRPHTLGTTMTEAEKSHAPVTQMIQVKDFRLKGHHLRKPHDLGTTMRVTKSRHIPAAQMIQVKDFRLKRHPLIRPLILGTTMRVTESSHVPVTQRKLLHFNRPDTYNFIPFTQHPREKVRVPRKVSPTLPDQRNRWINPNYRRPHVLGIPTSLYNSTKFGDRLITYYQKESHSILDNEVNEDMEIKSPLKKRFRKKLSHRKGVGKKFVCPGKAHSNMILKGQLASKTNLSALEKTTPHLNRLTQGADYMKFGRRIKPATQRPNNRFLSDILSSRHNNTAIKLNAYSTENFINQSLEMKQDMLHNASKKLLPMSNLTNNSTIEADQQRLNEANNPSGVYFNSYPYDIPHINMIRDPRVMSAKSNTKIPLNGQTDLENNTENDNMKEVNHSKIPGHPLQMKNVKELKKDLKMNSTETTQGPQKLTLKPLRLAHLKIIATSKTYSQKHVLNFKEQLLSGNKGTSVKIVSKKTSHYIHLLSKVLDKNPNFPRRLFYSAIHHNAALSSASPARQPIHTSIHMNQPSSHRSPQLSSSNHPSSVHSHQLGHMDHLPGSLIPLQVAGHSLLNSQQQQASKSEIRLNQKYSALFSIKSYTVNNRPTSVPRYLSNRISKNRGHLNWLASYKPVINVIVAKHELYQKRIKVENPTLNTSIARKSKQYNVSLNDSKKGVNTKVPHGIYTDVIKSNTKVPTHFPTIINRLYADSLKMQRLERLHNKTLKLNSKKPINSKGHPISVNRAIDEPISFNEISDQPLKMTKSDNSKYIMENKPYEANKADYNRLKTLSNARFTTPIPMSLYEIYDHSLKIDDIYNGTVKFQSNNSENSIEDSEKSDNSKYIMKKKPYEANNADYNRLKTLENARFRTPTKSPYEIYDHSLKIDDSYNGTLTFQSNNSENSIEDSFQVENLNNASTFIRMHDYPLKENGYNSKTKSNQSKADTEYADRIKISSNESIQNSMSIDETNHHSLEMNESQSKPKVEFTNSENGIKKEIVSSDHKPVDTSAEEFNVWKGTVYNNMILNLLKNNDTENLLKIIKKGSLNLVSMEDYKSMKNLTTLDANKTHSLHPQPLKPGSVLIHGDLMRHTIFNAFSIKLNKQFRLNNASKNETKVHIKKVSNISNPDNTTFNEWKKQVYNNMILNLLKKNDTENLWKVIRKGSLNLVSTIDLKSMTNRSILDANKTQRLHPEPLKTSTVLINEDLMRHTIFNVSSIKKKGQFRLNNAPENETKVHINKVGNISHSDNTTFDEWKQIVYNNMILNLLKKNDTENLWRVIRKGSLNLVSTKDYKRMKHPSFLDANKTHSLHPKPLKTGTVLIQGDLMRYTIFNDSSNEDNKEFVINNAPTNEEKVINVISNNSNADSWPFEMINDSYMEREMNRIFRSGAVGAKNESSQDRKKDIGKADFRFAKYKDAKAVNLLQTLEGMVIEGQFQGAPPSYRSFRVQIILEPSKSKYDQQLKKA